VEGENPPAESRGIAPRRRNGRFKAASMGGATGMVRIASGDSPEGVGVQLVAPNGVRTTVYTDGDRQIRIPEDASRFLHFAHSNPRSHSSPTGGIRFRSTVLRSSMTSCWREAADSDNLPASPALESQLSGAEILWNLPGTAEEKATLQKDCSAMPFLATDFQESL
jgi:hypothetical protein